MIMLANKKEIRERIKQLKTSISKAEKDFAADNVFSTLFGIDEWENARKILFYYSLPDELQTAKYLDIASKSKDTYLPRVNGDILELIKYEPHSIDVGAFNIFEPTSDKKININDIDISIVPAVAFDMFGNRIGRGRGFYDRLLINTNVLKIGIAYDFQLLEHLPIEQHDIKMDMIITPNNILRF